MAYPHESEETHGFPAGRNLRYAVAQVNPPADDPYLEALPQHQLAMVRAGLMLHRAGALKRAGKTNEAEEALATYQRLVARYSD